MAKKKNEITIKTDKLQEMVSRVSKGVGNNKILPITQMIAIKLEANVLTLISTDATNYLYIREDKVDGDDFYAVVPADKFGKLISRMTCDSIKLELTDSSLNVTGNGKYSVPLQFDEDGTMVEYPDPLEELEVDPGNSKEIQNTTVNVILNTVKPSLAVTLENPCYTGYYVGDKVVATDTYMISSLDVDLFGEPKLVSPQVMELLSVMSREKINVDFIGNIMLFSSPDCTVYGRELEGIEDYAIEAITGLVETDFKSMCKLPKSVLLQLLDRLTLFVSDYDKSGIYLTFTKDGMQVSSKTSNAVELIPYTESKNFESFTCCIDVTMLARQIKAQSGDVVELWYGEDNAIKMVDGKVTQIIALLEDDRLDEE